VVRGVHVKEARFARALMAPFGARRRAPVERKRTCLPRDARSRVV
jgi:hypothetical protein